MAANVELVDPKRIKPNPDNPRLIFHEDELAELEKSISSQGILVPLSIYPERAGYFLIDGERRWRCASRLGLHRVPAIIQSKPNKITNIMMMFAIHNARKDWDPLPTAMKLQELEGELTRAKGKAPKEGELAAAASLSRGEIRRLKKILRIPQNLKDEVMRELEKPRSEQQITLDQVLEATVAAERLKKSGLIPNNREARAAKAIVEKFRTKVLKNTTAPRKISKIISFVENGDVSKDLVAREVDKFLSTQTATIDTLYERTVQHEAAFQSVEQAAEKFVRQLEELSEVGDEIPDNLRQVLLRVRALIGGLVR